jgi:hypothetical protein
VWRRQGSSVDAGRCTTRFKNAHETVFRELLYRWHPWFGMRVAIHGAVDKTDGVVFRCTLSGSVTDRWLEVPAWMFERARCLDSPRLTASPFVSMDALSVLSDLLRQALKRPLSSSNAPHSGASRSSHQQNRGEGHDHAKPDTTASDAGRTAKASAKRPFPADRPVRQLNADADAGMAGLPEETRDTLTGLMVRLILEHAQISSRALRTEAGHDH